MVGVLLTGCVYNSKMPPLAEKKETSKPILISDASVFMGDPGQNILEHADILIEKGRISRIGEIHDLQTDYEKIDGKGKMVIPGLIDHHIHIHSPGAPPWFPVMPDQNLLDRNLSSYLYAGITTVFDMAGPLYDMEALEQRIQVENRVNPRLFYVGKCLNKKGGHPDYMLRGMIPWPIDIITIKKLMFQVSDIDDIRDAISENKAHGACMTKIMIDQLPLGIPSLYEDLAGQIVEESSTAELVVGAHIGSESDIITGLNAGVRFFAHAPYRSSVSDATIQMMKDNHAAIIPTLVVFDYSADFFKNTLQFTSFDKEVLDSSVLNAYMNVPLGGLDIKDPRLESWVHDLVTYREIKFDNVRRMKKAGITIIAGTDSPNVATVGGSSLHTEMRLLVEKCGFSPEEAVDAATSVSGQMLKRLTGVEGLGLIREGGPADLLILNKDFREDIRQTENIYMVIADGRIVDRNKKQVDK
jgi:imidazolonepropionase-like amidohydrolase